MREREAMSTDRSHSKHHHLEGLGLADLRERVGEGAAITGLPDLREREPPSLAACRVLGRG